MPSVVELRDVSLAVEGAELLAGATAHVVPGQRIALVGPNGAGKSTLLRALATPGEEPSDPYFTVTAGRVVRGGATLLVEQDDLQWSAVLDAGLPEAELRALPLPDALDLAAATDPAAAELAEAWRRTSAAAGRAGLGWDAARYGDTPLGNLSPGSAVRAFLALALLRGGTDLLLLDEPTNHLDLPSIVWLERTILASGAAVVVVSHDARFMDAVCDHVWSVDPAARALASSGARYSDYCEAEETARRTISGRRISKCAARVARKGLARNSARGATERIASVSL